MVNCKYQGVTGFIFKNNVIYLSLKIDFVLANSADPNEMAHYVAFHLCLHCLLKYPFCGLNWSTKKIDFQPNHILRASRMHV